MNSTTRTDVSLFEQATDWFIRIRAADASADELAAWLNWIEADSAHRAAFDRVQEIWHLVGTADPASLLAQDQALAPVNPQVNVPVPPRQVRRDPEDFTRTLTTSVGRSRSDARRNARRHPLRWIAAGLAAGVALVAVLPGTAPYLSRGWYAMTHSAGQHIASEHAAPRVVMLPDGSEVQLGADTGVQLRFDSQQRLIEAGEGEVFYRVKHDVERPFVVQAGEVTVTAVGTAFAIRREAGAVSVVVVEGTVDVDTAQTRARLRATAGERVSFDLGRIVGHTAKPAEAEAPVDWMPGRLLFQDEPLRVVVASLNRYAPKPIVLADPAMAELRFTGTVFEGRTQDWIVAAQRLFPLNVEESADHIALVRRD